MKKQSKESPHASHKSQKNESNDSSMDDKKTNINNIDEDAWFVCKKVWDLIETPVQPQTDGMQLHERLAIIQVRAIFRRIVNYNTDPMR